MQNESMAHSKPIIQTPPALPQAYFARPTVEVAQDLLGQILVVRRGESTQVEHYRIVETEAYTQDDPACHAYKGPTGRGATLYKAPGLAYVYLIYGMYHCLNVVTEPEGTAGAVLFRALEPLNPSEQNKPKTTHGPGRLCKTLNITKQTHHERSLTDATSSLYLAAGEPVPKEQVVTTTRIGISQAQDRLWRFYIAQNGFVSSK